MPLHPDLVKLVFAKLFLTYGSRFMGQYGTAPPETIESDWAHELAGVSRQAILYGLQNLHPDFPPNVLQFRAICRRKPMPAHVAISGPELPPDRVQQLAAQLSNKKPVGKDPKDWARKLRRREQGGERLSIFQREAWRTALGQNKDETATT
jgi:hypothetical protein